MSTNSEEPYTLGEVEFYWRDHYDWFLEQGFRLRPRYQPNWKPSWKSNPRLVAGLTEDSLPIPRYSLNDAIRIKDGQHVVLKRVFKVKDPQEASILKYFSQESVAGNPSNHCIPLLGLLQPPDDDEAEIVVLPLLRDFADPQFETIGEAVDFIRQMLEGFAFLHEHRVAHRDIRVENIMMDAERLNIEDFHICDPKKSSDLERTIQAKYTRTQQRPIYYIIDYGFATQYLAEEMPPSEPPRAASDNTAPEFDRMDEPCNPFPIDVYCVGHLLQMEFIDGHPNDSQRNGRHGFEFLIPLTEIMMKKAPEERVTMQEALTAFDGIVSDLSVWKLRSRATLKIGRDVHPKPFPQRVALTLGFWLQRIGYILRRTPPIPEPATTQ